MRQGTNWPHGFTLPFDSSTIEKVRVSYAQDNCVILTKTEKDCLFDGNQINLTMTQKETFRFDQKKNLQVQLRVLTEDGTPLTSEIFQTSVKYSLDREVL